MLVSCVLLRAYNTFMNIFYLDSNPQKAAEYHVDKHVIKMILESAQLLSTAHHLSSSPQSIRDNIYKATHKNHPSALWVRQNQNNYRWLFELFKALLSEYTYRFGKIHRSAELIKYLEIPPSSLPNEPFFPPIPVMDAVYVIADDSLASYRNYYRDGKKHLFTWTKRDRPTWL